MRVVSTQHSLLWQIADTQIRAFLGGFLCALFQHCFSLQTRMLLLYVKSFIFLKQIFSHREQKLDVWKVSYLSIYQQKQTNEFLMCHHCMCAYSVQQKYYKRNRQSLAHTSINQFRQAKKHSANSFFLIVQKLVTV